MSNYTISVDWDGKDDLADSNAAKVISGDDFQTEFETVQTAVNSKQDINGDSGEDFAMNNGTVAGTLTITGNPTAPTQSAGNSSTRLATTAFVDTSFAKKASPTFTGTPAAPTAATATDTTQIATTAFVQANTPAASQTVLGMAKIWTSGGDLYIATS